MGSSGGGYFRSNPDSIKQMLKDSESSTNDSEYKVQVDALLADLLSNFNDRDRDKINSRLDMIKKAIEGDIEGTVDLLFGGSVGKNTYVDGLSDIDSLVVLNKSDLAQKSPEEIKKYFAEKLKARLPKTTITVGNMAVTVKFKDTEVQLLPAIKHDGGLKVPSWSGDRWSKIKPKAFSEKLSKENSQKGMKIVPVVKLAKAIIANLPTKQQVSGYHAESLAVKVFNAYNGSLTPRDMLKHYFAEASKAVKQPIRDSTGQSVHVDEYLGASNSVERKIVSSAFDRVARRINNADSVKSVDEWNDLFK